MNDIITIHEENAEYPVSGRELHQRLGIETPYSKWFPRMCEYGFEAGKDFQTEDKNVRRADGALMPQTQADHMLTLSMAKELCMLQRTDAGREVRRYLIRVEDAWNSPDAIMQRALTIANDRVKRLTGDVLHLQAANSELTVQKQIMQPKADYFDELVERGVNLSFRETAKQLCVKERQFVSFLVEHRYVYRDKKGKLMPFAQYADSGLFVIKECYNEKTQWGGTQTLISPKGRETFRLLMEGLAS